MDKIGKYEILKRLGAGGFGEVFLGHDSLMERDVAIKMFRVKDENLLAFATSTVEEGAEILRSRFLAEARILAKLEDCPHVINVLEFGELDSGEPYYVMPYLPKSLKDRLGQDVFDVAAVAELPAEEQPRALPVEEALRLIEETLIGAAAAHEAGLVHRDLKPSNLLVSEKGQIRIADFGIAKAPDSGHSTVSQLGIGSRNYMAPEQRESAKHVDARADVYALGVIAYRMVTGKLPSGRYPDPNIEAPTIGKAMNALILHMLAEDKKGRPKDAGAALKQFKATLASVGETANDDATGTSTDVGGEIVSTTPEALQPLYDRVTEELSGKGTLEDSQAELEGMAHMVGVDRDGLQNIVADIAAQNPEAAGLVKLYSLVEQRVVASPQNEDLILGLLSAAKQVGKDKLWLEEAVARVRSRLSTKSAATAADPGGDVTEGTVSDVKQAPATPVDGPGRKGKLIAALLLVGLVGAGGWYGYSSYLDNQAALTQAAEARLAEEQAWAEAARDDTIAAYEAYLERWPNGDNKDKAARALAAKQEANRLAGLNAAEREREQVLTVQRLLNQLGIVTPNSGEADSRTIAAVKVFERQQSLPESGVVDKLIMGELQKELAKRDDAAWTAAQKVGRISDYVAYGKTWPEGRHISKIDDASWQRAKALNTEAGYNAYAAMFPNGKFIEQQASAIVQLKDTATRKADAAAWAKAAETNTEAAYQAYLAQYAAGQHAKEAQNILAQILSERQAGEARIALIKDVQTELIRLGYRGVLANGDIGRATKGRILDFQKAKKLEPTGAVSASLLSLLKATGKKPGYSVGETFKDCTDCPEMVVVPAGSFMMGSPPEEEEREDTEGPRHSVTIAEPFVVGQYEVTFDEWNACVTDGGCGGYNPSDNGWGQGRRPVIDVSWEDAKAYVSWLSGKTSKTYRLLSEAEWEYAARAGTTTPFHTGSTLTTNQANFNGRFTYGGSSKGMDRKKTVPVGSFAPNAFGLYDMHGNVFEWVEDCWHDTYSGEPTGDSAWCHRVLRGGGWFYDPGLSRSAGRSRDPSSRRTNSNGFRVARTLDASTTILDGGTAKSNGGRKGWLGVGIQPLTEDIANALEIDLKKGAMVTRVDPKSPAEKAGMTLGDIIFKWDGKDVADSNSLSRLVQESVVGVIVNVQILRKGNISTLAVRVDELSNSLGIVIGVNPAFRFATVKLKGSGQLPLEKLTYFFYKNNKLFSLAFGKEVNNEVSLRPKSKYDDLPEVGTEIYYAIE